MTFDTARGPVTALEGVSVDIPRGQFVSVLGPSGCGKSTLMMVIAGLLRPTSGRVRIGDTEVNSPYTNMGIVFQQDVLLDWRTVIDNVLLQCEARGLPKSRYRERALELLRDVGLEGFAYRRPYELSGGMRQRASICRALIHDPPLLLMDEPFGALDALTRDQMNVELLHIWEETKKTVVFITHSIEEAVFLSDRVLVMSERPGRLVDDIRIDLPRPRDVSARETDLFYDYVRRIRAYFAGPGPLVSSRARRRASETVR